MRTPAAEITVNGRPVASLFNERLVRVTITDKQGSASDSIRCDLEDGNPFIAIPRKGDTIGARLGYLETGLAYFGTFTADDPEVRCLPYMLSIAGKGASMREGLKEHKERHWDEATIKDIVTEIAEENGLTPLVDAKIGAFRYTWFGQQDESDIHFLERLARRHDAVFAIKDGKLIFAAKGTGKGTAGEALTAIVATPFNIVEGTCRTQFAHRFKFARAVAYTQDKAAAERVEVEAQSDAEGEADFHLGEPFADEAEAQAAATAKANDLKRETIATSVVLFGDPRIRAGAPFRYLDVRPELDGIEFIIETATHTLTKSGYTTAIEAKLKVPADDAGGTGDEGASEGGDPPRPNEPEPSEPEPPEYFYHPLTKGAPE